MKNIAFIGAGNMCRAIANGLLMSGELDCEHIKVYDKDEAKALAFKTVGVYKCESPKDALKFADYLFLSVKPQNMDEVLAELAGENFENKTIVTIAAGITTKHIESFLAGAAVIRVMPNTPMLIGEGTAAITKNENVKDEDFKAVCKMFEKLGTVCTMSEDKLNPVISLSGSSPAYVFLFIKIMCDWAKEKGFSEKEAKELVCSAFSGSADLLRSSEKSPEELIRDVSSPGGTTLEALAQLHKHGIETVIKDALDACEKRARELSK